MSDLHPESSNKKKGLGRGLGSLLGGANMQESSAPAMRTPAQGPVSAPNQVTTQPEVSPENRIWDVSIEKLSPGIYQPRRNFEKEKLQELAQSIKENGILQPITARRTAAGKLEIVAGERRWRAAQLAGLKQVPVILRTFEDRQALELAIVENIQREDLDAIEEAESYSRLMTEFNLSQQQVAQKVGRERATVANAVRLLGLPADVKEMVSHKTLSVGHAKVLLSLTDAHLQSLYAKKVLSEKINVRKLEKLVQSELAGAGSPLATVKETEPNVTQRLISGLSEELQKMLGTKVSIDYSDSKGKISIHFYSDDELTQLVDRLREGCQK